MLPLKRKNVARLKAGKLRAMDLVPFADEMRAIGNYFNPKNFVQNFTRDRKKIKSAVTKIGKPIYKAVRTGFGLLNNFDKGLQAVSESDIPVFSEIADIARNNPAYKVGKAAVNTAEETVEDGVRLAKKIDKYTDPETYGRVVNRFKTLNQS